MTGICPVCGARLDPFNEVEYEEETYSGAEGAEMKIVLPYCNIGATCNAVHAANAMDSLAEPFLLQVGSP